MMGSSFLLIVPLAALFLSASGKSLLSASDVCPSDEDIYPCYCDTDIFHYYVECDKVHDLEKLKGVLDKIKGRNVSFSLLNSRIGNIPSDLFSGQVFESVYFDNCQIGPFGDKPFSGLENTLNNIHIYGSVDKRRKDLETLPLSHLKKLKYVSFMANDIKKLGNEWFEGGPSTVEQLSLEANDIEILGDKAFASLENVEQIWLGDNRFQIVSRSMFPKPAKKLDILEISFNGIDVLPDDLFAEMPSLKTVNVMGNKLQTIDERIWRGIWGQLDEVYVDRNPLVCDSNLKWIYKTELPDVLSGSCAGYNKLRGKLLEELTMDDLDNV